MRELAEAAGVQVHSPVSHTLYVSDGRGPLLLGRCRGAPGMLLCVGSAPLPAPTCLLFVPPPAPLPQDPQLLLARNGGKPPLTMQSFTKLVDAGGWGLEG